MSLPPIEVAWHQPMQVGESPVWCADEAALYWIDIPACRVHCLRTGDGSHRDWALPSEPGSIVRCATGGLMVAMRSGIAHLDTATGALTSLLDAPYDPSLMRFNDGRCDAAGRWWVGTMYEPRDKPLGGLYRIERGTLTSMQDRLVPVTVSNGVAFGTDGRSLYRADTTAHAIRVYTYDAATGLPGAGRPFQRFSHDKADPAYGGRPDGAVIDSENCYWSALFEGGRLLRFTSTGALLQEVRLPVRCPTMMVFGGADLRTLYITTARQNRPAEELAAHPLSGCVLSLRVDTPGCIEPAYIPE